MTNNITIDLMSDWLEHINVPYTVVEKEMPCTGMVEIEIPPTEAACLIELGRKLEQNRSRLKTAA